MVHPLGSPSVWVGFFFSFSFFPKEFNPDFNWVFSIKIIFLKKLAVAD